MSIIKQGYNKYPVLSHILRRIVMKSRLKSSGITANEVNYIHDVICRHYYSYFNRAIILNLYLFRFEYKKSIIALWVNGQKGIQQNSHKRKPHKMIFVMIKKTM